MLDVKVLEASTFDNLIHTEGREALWLMAARCSCYEEATGSPRRRCKACGGKLGYIYSEPVKAKLLVQGISLTAQYAQMGIVELGDAMITIPTHHIRSDGNEDPSEVWAGVGRFDQFVLLDAESRAHENILRSPGEFADELMYRYPTEILQVLESDAETGEVKRYRKGVDYRLVVDGNNKGSIDWLPDGERPSDGKQFSVTYRYLTTFIAINEMPQPRASYGEQMPKRVHARFVDRVLQGAIGP